MSSPTHTGSSNIDELDADLQLFYSCAVITGVNKTCKYLQRIKYASGDPQSDRRLTQFQVFLNKLALVCDSEKGGDTITALTAIKSALGPAYYFGSNNRKPRALEDTRTFLAGLLDLVGENPDKLAAKPLQKQILWRILEFNHSRVGFYIKCILASSDTCIEQCREANLSNSKLLDQLTDIFNKAKLPRELAPVGNTRDKYLKDCESLIKSVYTAKQNGFGSEVDERAGHSDPDIALPWCELRHALSRLYAYRHAAEVIIDASQKWPALFKGFSVNCIPSARGVKLFLPRPAPETSKALQIAFPDINIQAYQGHLNMLHGYGLGENIQKELEQKSVRRFVHCEVNMQDFLVRNNMDDPSAYWNDSMFIATSKPPCRLCHYYFRNIEGDFEIQSSHMNTYTKWRLPDIYEESGSDAFDVQQELLEDVIDDLKTDTLRIVTEKIPEWQRNDSRTERAGPSTVPDSNNGGRSTRNSAPFPSMRNHGVESQASNRFDFEQSPLLNDEDDYVAVGVGMARG